VWAGLSPAQDAEMHAAVTELGARLRGIGLESPLWD
jgi:hypothetical protein